MDERRSDTEETFGDQDPPGAVSNQNGEEAPVPAGTERERRDERPRDGGEGDGES